MSAAAVPGIQTQRRANYRIKADWWVRIHVPWEVATQLVDISLSGARFMGELPCTPGVPLSFVLEVPDIGDVPFDAEVVWVGSGASGVRFTGVNNQRSELLREALLAEERKLLREKAHPAPEIWHRYGGEDTPDPMRAEGLEPPRAKPTGT